MGGRLLPPRGPPGGGGGGGGPEPPNPGIGGGGGGGGGGPGILLSSGLYYPIMRTMISRPLFRPQKLEVVITTGIARIQGKVVESIIA